MLLPLACALWPIACGAGEADGIACVSAVADAERTFLFPDGLLGAIARVESGRADPVTGQRTPWPWTVTADGTGQYYQTKAEAIAATIALQQRGTSSIDVGCLQVNLSYHPHAFASLDAAFDPVTNVTYASRFLASLFSETADWLKAAGAYHSRTPSLAEPYMAMVAAAWRGGVGQLNLLFGLPVVPSPLFAGSATAGVGLPVPAQAQVQGVRFASGSLDETWRPVPLPPARPHRAGAARKTRN